MKGKGRGINGESQSAKRGKRDSYSEMRKG